MKHLKEPWWNFRPGRGQVMIIFALFLVMLLSFVALSIDVGNLLAERRGVHNAVDAAAMAGGRLILLEETGDIETQARGYVDANGYDGTAAVVSFPDESSIAVELTQDVMPFFLAAFYDGPWRVNARAMATVVHEIKEVGLLALGENPGACTGNPGNSTGVIFGGNAHVNIAASVLSNGCIVFNGNATDGSIDGSVEAHSDVQEIPDDLYVDEDSILTGQPLIDDPFADLDPPDCSDLPLRDQNSEEYQHPEDDEHLILEPGRYEGTIQERRISLQSGVYCFMDRLNVQPDGFIRSFDTVDANGIPQYHVDLGENSAGGVLMYFGPNARYAMHGTSHIAVKSLGSQWEDIVIWFTNCSQDLKLTGNNDTWIVGVIYAPCSTVDLTGNSESEVPIGAIVAYRIEIGGTPTLNFNSSITIEIQPPRVYLVE
jgi:hypothetical protein